MRLPGKSGTENPKRRNRKRVKQKTDGDSIHDKLTISPIYRGVCDQLQGANERSQVPASHSWEHILPALNIVGSRERKTTHFK